MWIDAWNVLGVPWDSLVPLAFPRTTNRESRVPQPDITRPPQYSSEYRENSSAGCKTQPLVICPSTSTAHTYTRNPARDTSHASQTNSSHGARETHAYSSCRTPSALPLDPRPAASLPLPVSPRQAIRATSCTARSAASGRRSWDTRAQGSSCCAFPARLHSCVAVAVAAAVAAASPPP